MVDSSDAGATLPARFGRYHVVAAIPGGAMGRLYLAQDPEIDRMVVVKALDSGSSADQKTRFLREAKAAGRLNHPNVVSIFDVGEQDRTPFIVMEYIEGETLASIIRNREPILFSRRLELIDQLCAGLAYAHDQSVVHRDIKPSNLMLDKSGKLRILDFGIARIDTSDATQTSTGIVGTLNYMSPEQWEGGVIEGRSDMFSVGAVMYELFSFAKAFPGNTPPEVLRYMFGEGPRPLQEVCPLAPPALADVVARMLARTPAERYPNLHAVREALAGLRAQVRDLPVDITDKTAPMAAAPPAAGWTGPLSGGATRPTGATGWPMRSGATTTQVPPGAPATSTAAPPARRWLPFMLIGAAVVVAVGAWLLFRGSSPESPGGPASTAAVNPPAPSAVTPATPPAAQPEASSPPGPTGAAGKPAGATAGDTGRGTAEPPAAPAPPVDLVVSWSLPFDVVQNGRKLTTAAGARQTLKGVKAEAGELYADNREYRLHFNIPTGRSGSIQVPEPGRFAVTLATQYMECTVVVDGADLKKGPIFPGRPETIAAGRHIVTLRCPNGKPEPQQIVEVKSVLEPTVVSFPKDSGG